MVFQESSSDLLTSCNERLLTFEAYLEAELSVLGVVKRPEERRAGVGLHVGRQERVQGVVGANADPRVEVEDLEAMLHTQLEPRVGWEAALIARPDEIEGVVDR